MSNLKRLGDHIVVPMKPDEEGYVGRECPDQGCLGYFKITPGTGVKGAAPCHCPYCGHTGDHIKFGTRDQLEYAKSVAVKHVTEAVLNGIKGMKVQGRPHPIRYYREKQLETEVTCDHCTLRYAIYGAFGFCPDCGVHNSHQILDKNLELAAKQIALAGQVEADLANQLTGNALEDAVSSFDSFGRETCRVRAASATEPSKAERVSFQNLVGARQRLQDLFTINLAATVTTAEWDFACQCFQKRHLLAHSMGVVDEAYMRATADPAAVIGRKVAISPEEVVALVGLLKKLGAGLLAQLPKP